MKSKLAQWRTEMKSDENFRTFYFFAFDYLKEKNKVILRTSAPICFIGVSSICLSVAVMDEAITIWEMLSFPARWQFWDKWTDFLQVRRQSFCSLMLFATDR